MYSAQFRESLSLVEAAREKNIALEPDRMTAKQKEDLLAAFHPDYKQEQFMVLQMGPNKGEKVPLELAALLQANSRLAGKEIDLSNPDYDVDVLVIGGGGAGSSAAIEAHEAGGSGAGVSPHHPHHRRQGRRRQHSDAERKGVAGKV